MNRPVSILAATLLCIAGLAATDALAAGQQTPPTSTTATTPMSAKPAPRDVMKSSDAMKSDTGMKADTAKTASHARCHDAKGKFVKCPATATKAKAKQCRDAKGKFVKCPA